MTKKKECNTHLQRDGAVKDLASGDCGVVRRGVCAFFRALLSRESVEEGEGVGGDAVACAITAKCRDQNEGWKDGSVGQ